MGRGGREMTTLGLKELLELPDHSDYDKDVAATQVMI